MSIWICVKLMLGIQAFLAAHISNPWALVFLLGILPFSEARGAIIYGLLAGLSPEKLFFISVAANILAIPLAFWLLGRARVMALASRFLGRRIERQIDRNRRHFEKYGELALLVFVAAPVIGTGAWTGALLAEALKLRRQRAIIVISAGVMLAALLAFIGAEFLGSITGLFIGS